MSIEFSNPVVIFDDNQACIQSFEKSEQKKLKHVDIQYQFVKDIKFKGDIDVKFVESKEQIADILTKGVSAVLFTKFRERLGLVQIK